MRIVPAILEKNLSGIREKLALVDGMAELLQIDIMDGEYVDSISFNLAELLDLKISSLLEIHLMVKKPALYLDVCQKLKAVRVYWHADAEGAVEALAYGQKMNFTFERGLAVNPDIKLEDLAGEIEIYDSVLVMGVVPGKQGQSFIPETVERITWLRNKYPKLHLSVDGGVSEDNLEELKAAGVNDFDIGSALLKAENVREKYQYFLNMIKD